VLRYLLSDLRFQRTKPYLVVRATSVLGQKL